MEFMDWTEDGLRAVGFKGFVSLADAPAEVIPTGPGVYVVLRYTHAPPEFSELSQAGHIKGKDPTVDGPALRTAWVTGASVLYIGKAAAGNSGRRGLRRRLTEYRRHGRGEPVSHWGGRYVWQLADCAGLLAAWRTTDLDEDPESLESGMIAQFVADYGARPFANRKLGTRTGPVPGPPEAPGLDQSRRRTA